MKAQYIHMEKESTVVRDFLGFEHFSRRNALFSMAMA